VQDMNRAELKRLIPLRLRYEHFTQTNSHLANRLKIKDIASYLNIAPGTLSTVRSKIM
jgi:CRP-like cAMP-binding protein